MATAHEPQQKDNPAKPAAKSSEPKNGYQDRFWIPRFWDGMSLSGWFRLLRKNGFRVTPLRWAMALIITATASVNAVLWLVQYLLYRRRIEKTQLVDDPIFVIGHWRSGTTLLHELLVLDERFTFSNTYDCFAPNHFLVSARFLRPLVGLLLPKQRPMDNMAAGWSYPQEDEFALCNLGLPSPYLTIAFPNHPPQNQEFFAMDHAPAEEAARWRRGFMWFVKCLTVRTPKQIVLKSPPHTFRVKVLLKMFPKARFVHIIRDPYVLFPSTVNLWKRLYRNEGLQVPRYEGLEEHVYETFRSMYEVFERDRGLIPPGQFCQVRYEDLVAAPLEQMRRVYDEMHLGDFETVQPALQKYFAEKADYKTNRYQLSPELKAEIARRWGFFFERYGYPIEQP